MNLDGAELYPAAYLCKYRGFGLSIGLIILCFGSRSECFNCYDTFLLSQQSDGIGSLRTFDMGKLKHILERRLERDGEYNCCIWGCSLVTYDGDQEFSKQPRSTTLSMCRNYRSFGGNSEPFTFRYPRQK